jgi:hypothetical protein
MVLAVTVAGCNRFPDNGLQISANLLPDSSCLVSGDQDTRLLRGLYDVAYRDPSGQAANYIVALQVQSYLITNAVEFQGEQNNLRVDNLDITLLLPDGTQPVLPGGLTNPYRVTTNAVIPTTDPGADPSVEVAAAIGIPALYQDALLQLFPGGSGSVLLDIRAGGTTFGGFSQRSAVFRWPVDICTGCLEFCASEDLLDSCLPGQDVWPYCSL